jgi:DNA-binding CsgD family transcriptional regulator
MKPRLLGKEHGDRRPREDGPHEHDGVRDIALVAFSLYGRRAYATEIDELWQGLLEGGWQLVDRFDCHNVRYLIFREETCSVRGCLSRMEGLVLRLAVRGAANKEIAIDLQVSPSSVATYLRRALLKRGFLTRLRLRETYAFLLDADGSAAASSGDEAGTPTDTDCEEGSRRASRSSTLRITEVSNPRGRLTVIARNIGDGSTELTPAERDVARRAAAGMSNHDIALRKQRSMRTIANQLASAFRKLDVTSRSELAAALVSRRPLQRRTKTEPPGST